VAKKARSWFQSMSFMRLRMDGLQFNAIPCSFMHG
jgi:hypothetical protein